jgi:fucose permease
MLELFFVIGALGGQFIVTLFEINSFLVLGLGFIIPIIGIIIWPLPDLYDVLTDYGEEGLKPSFRSKFFICMVFFCFATAEMGIGSWMPTYSIKAGVADTKGSSLFSLLFWGPNCLVRLFWIYMPTSIEKKLGIALNLVLVAAITTLFLQLSG